MSKLTFVALISLLKAQTNIINDVYEVDVFDGWESNVDVQTTTCTNWGSMIGGYKVAG